MSHGTTRISAADDSIGVTDAVITALSRNSIQIDSATSLLTPLAVGDIVLLSGSTGAGNNNIFRVAQELVVDDSYVFFRLNDDHDDCSTETVDSVNLAKSSFMRINSVGAVLQFPTGTYSIQPMVSADGKVFINEGAALTGTATRRVIANHVGWLRFNTASVTGTVEIATDY